MILDLSPVLPVLAASTSHIAALYGKTFANSTFSIKSVLRHPQAYAVTLFPQIANELSCLLDGHGQPLRQFFKSQ